MISFRSALVKLMARRHLSVADVALVAGCSKPTVRRWIGGVNEPHPAMHSVVLKELNRE